MAGAAAATKVPKQVTKSPSMALSYLVSVASLLTGASVVHNVFKPDLTIPDVSSKGIEVADTSNTTN
ncbi:uncharacterized protein [Physcomitrium patens]|uniref:Uncharacterized protein n=1 Tax=Physcomitrium patens TaxID=3218 RepID=A0A2K1KUM9_PHYPA|nr:hypothetical protein PHYPA_004440 [Physcomitrium patens]